MKVEGRKVKKLVPIAFMALMACNQQPAETSTDPKQPVVWTKTMEYAVDLNSVFHQDLNDEDFSDVSALTQQLLEDVFSGKLTAYDRVSDDPLTAEAAKALLRSTDTVWFEEPETGDMYIEIVERDHTQDFYGFTFREQWSYNTEGAIINRKILGIAPRIPVYSSRGGELYGFTSAFWVKYE